jgi:hypothetical protein
VRRLQDRHGQDVSLSLQEPGVAGHATVDAEAGHGLASIASRGMDKVGDLQGHALEGGSAQLGGGRATR